LKHHETRLQADLSAIREEVGSLADGVRMAVDEAIRGLLDANPDRMYQVMLQDHRFNRQSRKTDADCHAFVARHLPAAGHLRFVSSVLRLSIALERIGDYAVTISRVGVHLDQPLPQSVKDDIRTLADQAIRMLELSTRAFLKGDAALARDTKKMAKRVDKTHDRIFSSLVSAGSEHTLLDVIRIETIFDKLERVSDQAKNICEEAVFATTGETKQPKVYRVLFVDADDGFMAPLAAALARRAYPGSGEYGSTGLAAAERQDKALATIADQLQLDVADTLPTTFNEDEVQSKAHHVLVALNIDVAQLPRVPFHTILLDWQLPDPRAESGETREQVSELNGRIATLMETLRGEDAP